MGDLLQLPATGPSTGTDQAPEVPPAGASPEEWAAFWRALEPWARAARQRGWPA